MIIAAHPASSLRGAAPLLAEISGDEVVCVDVSGRDSFDAMVDDLERARRQRGVERTIFWGMSGGGWLAQLYAHRHPEAVSGIIIESACLCFRERLRDPTCALSPLFPSWRAPLEERGLSVAGAHDEAASAVGAEWLHVDGVGDVLRQHDGPALLVSPMPVDDAFRRQMPLLWTFDARPWIAQLRVPALVIAGAVDPVVPAARVRSVHEALVGSTFLLAEGATHVPSTAKPAVVVAAVREFVEQLNAAVP